MLFLKTSYFEINSSNSSIDGSELSIEWRSTLLSNISFSGVENRGRTSEIIAKYIYKVIQMVTLNVLTMISPNVQLQYIISLTLTTVFKISIPVSQLLTIFS